MGLIRVHPEGVPAEEQALAKPVIALPAASAAETHVAPSLNLAAPVERVKKFWGEFF
jgi:hypothetical protein